jgi:hypothetical protein
LLRFGSLRFRSLNYALFAHAFALRDGRFARVPTLLLKRCAHAFRGALSACGCAMHDA